MIIFYFIFDLGKWGKITPEQLISQEIPEPYSSQYADELNQNIKFQSKEINENRSVTKNIDEMVENLAWHLEISGQNYTKDEIKNKIINLAKGDEISESIATCVKVMIFWKQIF